MPNAVVLNGNITLAPTGLGGNSSGGSGLTLSGPVTVTGNSTVTVNSGGLGDTFSGNIGGAGQLTIAGLGGLTLAGASDTYLGGTVLAMSDGEVGVEASQGTLTVANGSDLGSGRLTLTSGTLLASASVTIANAVAFTANSYVAFGGSPITFSGSGGTLSGTANLIVNTNTTFGGGIGNGASAGNLDLFSGTSTLFLQAADAYSGSTTVNGGTLVLKAGGTLTSGTIAVNVGGTFTEDNSASNGFPAGRLLGSPALTLNGGTFQLLGGGAGSTENFTGGITLGAGYSTIAVNSAAGPATITASALNRNTGATVNFEATGTQILGSTSDEIEFGTLPAPVNGIFPFATVTDGSNYNGGFNLATYAANGIAALPKTSYTPQAALTFTGSDSTANVLVTSNLTLPVGGDTVNAILVFGDGITVTGPAGTTLGVGSGQVAVSGATSLGDTISAPLVLAFGTAEGLVFTNSGQDTISSTITGTDGLTVSGPGNLVLPNPSSYNNSSNPNSQDVQVVNIGTTATGGSFTLSFDGATTAAITFNPVNTLFSTALDIQTALQALPTIGAGNVLVTPNTAPSFNTGPSFTVTFSGGLAGSDQPLITAPPAGNALGVPTGAVPALITTAVTTVGVNSTTLDSGTLTLGTNNAISGGLTVIGGTIQSSNAVTLAKALDFGFGQTASSSLTVNGTNPIIFSGGVNLLGLTAVLNAVAPTYITGVLGDGVTIPGSATTPSTVSTTSLIKQGGGTLTLTSANSYTTPTLIDQGIVNVRNNASLGLVQSEVQVISFSSGGTSASTFTLAFNGATTATITYSTVAATLVSNIQTALTQLSTIGAGNTVVTGTTPNAITVTFQNLLADLNEPALTVPTQPSPATASVTTTVVGFAPATVGVASGATLQLQGGTNNLTLCQSFILNGNGVTLNGGPAGAIDNISGSNTINGAIPGTLPGTIFLGSAISLGGPVGTLTLTGIVSGRRLDQDWRQHARPGRRRYLHRSNQCYGRHRAARRGQCTCRHGECDAAGFQRQRSSGSQRRHPHVQFRRQRGPKLFRLRQTADAERHRPGSGELGGPGRGKQRR